MDRGNADTVTRLYEPAKAAAPSASGRADVILGLACTAGRNAAAHVLDARPGRRVRGLSEIGVVVEELTSQSTGCGLNQSTLRRRSRST